MRSLNGNYLLCIVRQTNSNVVFYKYIKAKHSSSPKGHPKRTPLDCSPPLQLHLGLGSDLRFLRLLLSLILCPLLQVLRFLEETLLVHPDNQLQLHLLINLVDHAGRDLCGEDKTTFVYSNLALFHHLLFGTVSSYSLCLYICFMNMFPL